MSNRLKAGLQLAFLHAFIMFIVSWLLGGEPNWTYVSGFAVGGFIGGYFVQPFFEKRRKKRAT
ncbi:drug/metabolite transporter (DMT)-like permease [Alkalihalobacillus xiaoxiensis]|uniref:Drug/metabolite transporter (DMT)-like permease n=1 Tax=Shouchella xiaoxiensis TaxID=766895 RepID=A0ABS2SZ95_9BACI|nr:hypothetical protein [Shouchella xiaoxiensis]MBM7840842.1 drug/metabolite transporter (DMT)-like permease [Shouchella xiaoxiensis]